jgi:hypothetical protein
MQVLDHRRRFVLRTMAVLLCSALCGSLTGCSNNLSESDVLSKLEAAGLTVERLSESLLTSKQRQRIEHEPETVLSVRVSDAAGNSQSLALVGFDQDWKADRAKDEGVPGFVVRNWFFAGGVTAPQIQSQIEAALQ